MGQDILSQTAMPLLGVFQLGQQVLTIGNAGGQGGANNSYLIATGVTLQYGRQNTPFVPLNVTGKYLVSGIPSGQLSLDSLIGPGAQIKAFLKAFSGNPCGTNNNIQLAPCLTDTCSGAKTTDVFTCQGCVLAGISVSAAQLGGGMQMLIGRITLDVISVT